MLSKSENIFFFCIHEQEYMLVSSVQFIFVSRRNTEYLIRNTGTGSDGRSCHLSHCLGQNFELARYSKRVGFLPHRCRDRFRERGALGHLNFWGPTQVSYLAVCLKNVKVFPSYV